MFRRIHNVHEGPALFFKLQFGGHFKAVFIFSETHIPRIFVLQSLESPEVKLEIFFCDGSKDAHRETEHKYRNIFQKS